MLSKQNILDAVDRKIEPVSVPEWGGEIFVRSMTGHERANWSRAVECCYYDGKLQDWSGLQTQLLIATVCDSEGKLLFEVKDALPLSQKNAAILSKIFSASARLNGLTSTEADQSQKDFTPTPKN